MYHYTYPIIPPSPSSSDILLVTMCIPVLLEQYTCISRPQRYIHHRCSTIFLVHIPDILLVLRHWTFPTLQLVLPIFQTELKAPEYVILPA